MNKETILNRFNELSEILLKELNNDGFITGRLSSSALAVAVAIAALHFYDSTFYNNEIRKGLDWLQSNINKDGSFGDTPESCGNVSASLLVYAAINLYAERDEKIKKLQEKITGYLLSQGIDVNSSNVSKAILGHYKKDYTFSVPILTMCGLCGIPPEKAFDEIPQLPFELSLLPRRFYKFLNLSVVSYAIPALIAVGIIIFKKKKSGFLLRFIRKKSIKKSLGLLQKLMPESGGFLEAIPLTAFVCLSLISAGYKDIEVVKKGIIFLKKTQRSDGSWPIDIDLSTWVTSLSVKALRTKKDQVLTEEKQIALKNYFIKNQNTGIHPFNGSGPGGWGWTNHSGSVPDGDDTSGVIIALLQLGKPDEIKQRVISGCKWLVNLQNNDGGIPTFSRGWGKLPFDKSCADVTGHAFLAVSSVIEAFGEEIKRKGLNTFKNFINKTLIYLEKHQNKDGSWLPLWFGNQCSYDHSNPVYGTSKVLIYLGDALPHKWIDNKTKVKIQMLLNTGRNFLLKTQNSDGSWGGDENIEGTIEETGLAVQALSADNYQQQVKGMEWLNDFYTKKRLKAAPVGLYFASLWYDEKMYPLTIYLETTARLLGY